MGERINENVKLGFKNLGAVTNPGTGEYGFLFATLRTDQVANSGAEELRQNLAYAFVAESKGAFENLLDGLPSNSPYRRQKADYESAKSMLQNCGSSEDHGNPASPLRSCCSYSTHVPLLVLQKGGSTEAQIQTVLNVTVVMAAETVASPVPDHLIVDVKRIKEAEFKG